MINSALVIYRYLRIVKETDFADAGDRLAITLGLSTKGACVVPETIEQSLGTLSLASC